MKRIKTSFILLLISTPVFTQTWHSPLQEDEFAIVRNEYKYGCGQSQLLLIDNGEIELLTPLTNLTGSESYEQIEENNLLMREALVNLAYEDYKIVSKESARVDECGYRVILTYKKDQ